MPFFALKKELNMIFRVKQKLEYTAIPNSLIDDMEISNEALGVMCRILHFAQKQDFTVKDLLKFCKGKEAFVKERLKELELRGYLVLVENDKEGK